jgi:hypothetical protein
VYRRAGGRLQKPTFSLKRRRVPDEAGMVGVINGT